MSYVLIIAAKSDIAKALAREYASEGYNLYLAARDVTTCEPLASDLAIRHQIKTSCHELDINAFETHQAFYESLPEKPLGVISVVGYLGAQDRAQNDFDESLTIINSNATGPISLLNIIANDFEQRGSGFIVGVSSVAGDRGRKSNYIYGSAKAAFTAYLSGLRHRLAASGVHVLTVKPGFVDTQMTAGMDLPKMLTAQPEAVAKAILKAQQKNKNVLYTKAIFWLVMLIIKHIPESIFKKTDL